MTMSWRIMAAALLTGGSAVGTPVHAQDMTQVSTRETAQDRAEDQADPSETVIYVTAQRREQELQETPLAISAITSEQVELQGISEVRDVSALAPNVSILQGTTNATAAIITIRGVPTLGDETQGFDTPIGLYLDGVYLARSAAASFEVADIERIEVLRGPQGTLFGRNTIGGAINFITRDPEEQAGVRVRLGLGNYDQRSGRIIVNSGRIGDRLRLSAGYVHRERSGVVDNLLQPDDSLDPGSNNVDSARVALVFDITDRITLRNVFDYTRIDSVIHTSQLAEVGGGIFRPDVTIDGFTFAQVQPANLAGYLASATALEPQCGPPLASVSLDRLDSLCLEGHRPSTDKIYGNMTRLEIDLDAVRIRSTTAFRGWRNRVRGGDLDGLGTIQGPLFSDATVLNGMPLATLSLFLPAGTAAFLAGSPVPTTTQPLFQVDNKRSQSQFSQEVEVVSNLGGDFEFVVGGFYFRERGFEFNPQRFLFVLDTNQAVFTPANFGPLAPLLQAGNPARFRGIAQESTLGYRVRSRSIAVYGQAQYRPGGPNGALGITLGLRYTWDRRSVSRFQNGPTPFADPIDIALNNRSATFEEPTGDLTVDYRLTDDVMLYGRIARGYGSGGFNLRQTTNAAANLGLIPFTQETIWSYELGFRTEFFGRIRLNGAVFYNEYSDQLVNIPIPITGGGSFGTQVVNAGKTIYTGVELEGLFRVTDNITIDGSFGYVGKDVRQFPSADVTGAIRNIAGVIRLGNSPDYTASAGVTARYPIGAAHLIARVAWNYVSSQRGFPNPLTAPFAFSTSGEARGLWDAQLRIENIRIGNMAHGLGITLWGRNLTDEEYVARGIDFGQLGFGSVFYGDPRTYGVTLDVEF
jgi:iron complex outermembrane recepter protein